MTHTRSMADSEGDFDPWELHPDPCRQCGAVVHCRTWESSDGAYEDEQYRCANGHIWWIDGIDS